MKKGKTATGDRNERGDLISRTIGFWGWMVAALAMTAVLTSFVWKRGWTEIQEFPFAFGVGAGVMAALYLFQQLRKRDKIGMMGLLVWIALACGFLLVAYGFIGSAAK